MWNCEERRRNCRHHSKTFLRNNNDFFTDPTYKPYISAEELQDCQENCQQFYIRNFFVTQCALQVCKNSRKIDKKASSYANGFIITWILLQIIMFSNKVNICSGLKKTIPHHIPLPYPLSFIWINDQPMNARVNSNLNWL